MTGTVAGLSATAELLVATLHGRILPNTSVSCILAVM